MSLTILLFRPIGLRDLKVCLKPVKPACLLGLAGQPLTYRSADKTRQLMAQRTMLGSLLDESPCKPRCSCGATLTSKSVSQGRGGTVAQFRHCRQCNVEYPKARV